MATITLVEELIEDGRKLIDRLVQESIPVITACWVKPVEEDRWSLFIATPLVDEKGAAHAYREVYRVLRTLGKVWVTDSDISLVGQDDRITRDILEIERRSPGKLPLRSREPQLGRLAVEEAYVYPQSKHEAECCRQSFIVDYFRTGNPSEWRAKTSRGEILEGNGPHGLVGYSTAHWEGESLADVKHAAVFVLLETDPRVADGDLADDEELIRTLTRQANLMADRMFKQHHPDAVILRDQE